MKCWNPVNFRGWTRFGTQRCWTAVRTGSLFSQRTFYGSGRRGGEGRKKKKKGDENKTLLTLIHSAVDRKASKQSPGAGAFWWTKLPARRLHVSQVNKTQRTGGETRRRRRRGPRCDRVRLRNPRLCFFTDQRRCLDAKRQSRPSLLDSVPSALKVRPLLRLFAPLFGKRALKHTVQDSSPRDVIRGSHISQLSDNTPDANAVLVPTAALSSTPLLFWSTPLFSGSGGWPPTLVWESARGSCLLIIGEFFFHTAVASSLAPGESNWQWECGLEMLDM